MPKPAAVRWRAGTQPEPRPAHYTIAAAAEYAGVGVKTVRRAIQAGHLKAVSPRGTYALRIPAAALDEWLQPAHGAGERG